MEKDIKTLVIGLPDALKGKTFRTLKYVHGTGLLKSPYKFSDYASMQYIKPSGEKHLFIASDMKGTDILLCEEVS